MVGGSERGSRNRGAHVNTSWVRGRKSNEREGSVGEGGRGWGVGGN